MWHSSNGSGDEKKTLIEFEMNTNVIMCENGSTCMHYYKASKWANVIAFLMRDAEYGEKDEIIINQSFSTEMSHINWHHAENSFEHLCLFSSSFFFLSFVILVSWSSHPIHFPVNGQFRWMKWTNKVKKNEISIIVEKKTINNFIETNFAFYYYISS